MTQHVSLLPVDLPQSTYEELLMTANAPQTLTNHNSST